MDSFWGRSRSEERLPRQRSNGKFTAAVVVVVGVGSLSKAAVVLRAAKDTRDPQETKESPESR